MVEYFTRYAYAKAAAEKDTSVQSVLDQAAKEGLILAQMVPETWDHEELERGVRTRASVLRYLCVFVKQTGCKAC